MNIEHRTSNSPEASKHLSASVIAIWHVKLNIFTINDFDVLNDNMFSDLCCQVNEFYIMVEVVKGFNPMIVF